MKEKKQMSESIPVILLLTLVGGFQDAYSYNMRSHVFANAQTGNIVLFTQNLAFGDFERACHYFFPIIAFVLGVYYSERLRRAKLFENILHWRQGVLFIETIFLVIVGFLSENFNDLANILMSFTCAMQVNSFRKLHGQSLATTMCIGNMRSATELLYHYRLTKDPEYLTKSLRYYMVIFVFAGGAALGAWTSQCFKLRAIWIAAILLMIVLCLMFIRIKKESEER